MKDFKGYFLIPAEPAMVWAALTREATIRLWTGAQAEFRAEPGSEFSMWDDDITGRNIELEENRKLVQQWHFDGEAESIVTLTLHPHKKGTSLEVRHTNIPDEYYENIAGGWQEVYMGSLQEFFEGESA